MPKHSTHSWLYRPLYPNIGSQCYISIYILFYEISRCKPASFPVCSHKMFVIVTATQPTIANLPQWQSSLPWANCHEAKLSCLKTRWLVRSTLWLFNIAMENGPFIEGLPINSMVIFYGYVSHNQMVSTINNAYITDTSTLVSSKWSSISGDQLHGKYHVIHFPTTGYFNSENHL